MKQEWSTRAYREGDEERILELWRAVYPSMKLDRGEWLRWWSWMYRGNPAGRGIIRLAEADGRIVAQYAIAPTLLKIGSKVIKSSLSLDTMTHPDYRRRGMFEVLSKEVYSEAASIGIDIVYGFPNRQTSYPGFISKLDWFDVSMTKVRIRPVNCRNAVRVKIKNRLLSGLLAAVATPIFNSFFSGPREASGNRGLAIVKATSFDERVDRLWARVSDAHPIMVVRNKDHLNWRYSAPDKQYSIFIAETANEVGGYLVLRHITSESVKYSVIFDMMAESEEVMGRLVAEAVRDCRQAGVDFIMYRLIADKAYHRVSRRNGFFAIPFSKVGDYFCVHSNSAQIPKEFLRDPGNWLVQTGDSDVL